MAKSATNQRRTTMLCFGAFMSVGFAAAGCTPSDSISSEAAPITSIAFCEEPVIAVPEDGTELTDAALEQQFAAGDAIAEITETFGDRPEWAGSFYDRTNNRVVIALTSGTGAWRDDIEHHTQFDVDTIVVDYSVGDRQRAGELLLDLFDHDENPNSPLTGFGIEGLFSRVEISLSTFENVETLARDWSIPPPLDLYCIMSTADSQADSKGS